MRPCPLITLILLLLSSTDGLARKRGAGARVKEMVSEGAQPAANAEEIPALAALLEKTGWTPTPELSGAFRAGHVFRPTEREGHQLVANSCFDAKVEENTYTEAAMVTTLQAGVSVGLAGFKAKVGGSIQKKIKFGTPIHGAIPEFELIPTPDCTNKLAHWENVDQMYVVKEVLSAIITEQTCGTIDAKGRFMAGMIGVTAEVREACAQSSLEPVAVGYRTVPMNTLIQRGRDAMVANFIVPSSGAKVEPVAIEATGEVEIRIGAGANDFAALASQVETEKQARLIRNAEIERADANAARSFEMDRQRLREKEAAVQDALERERAAAEASEAQARMALEAEIERRLASAAMDIEHAANTDFAAIAPLLEDELTVETRSVLISFLSTYGAAEVRIDGVVHPVELDAVRAVRARLGEVMLSAPNGIGAVFAELPPGAFTMGCTPERDAACEGDESAHRVQLTHAVAMATTEVTQRQWEAVMTQNPSRFENCGGDCPVEQVSWNDAIEFANRLSEMEALEPCYTVNGSQVDWPEGLDCEGYRLPTEAEWEYAARAGSDTRYAGGDEPEAVAWFSDNSRGQPHASSGLSENAWGLHDMSGNVWEWVWDRHAPFGDARVVAPIGPTTGSSRVHRGGSWYLPADDARVSRRYSYSAGYREHDLGFRIARTIR